MSTSVHTAFQRALAHHQNGRLQDAEQLYLQVLEAMPRHADALHLLGVIALQCGNFEAAADLIQQAIDVQPSANFYCNLGNALKEQGRRREAIASYRQALTRDANLAEAWCNLGDVLLDEGEPEEAANCCRRAIEMRPGFAEAHCNLGNALLKQGKLDGAIGCYRHTLRLRPGLAVAHSNLGHALARHGRPDEAVVECQRAIQLQPRFAAAYSHLADALSLKGMAGDALDVYRQALAIGPDSADLQRRMGRAFRQVGRLDLAIQSTVAALQRSDDGDESRQGDIKREFVQTISTAHFTAPDAAVRGYVLRALHEVWADAGDLLTPATSLVENNPAVVRAVALAAVPARPHEGLAHSDGAGTPARLDPALLAAIADDQLLRSLLQTDALNSIALERLLTLVRRQLLDDVTRGQVAVDGATALLHAAIAQQCFINEYVYAVSDDELQQLRQLRARLDACLAAGATPQAQWLVASAAFASLATLDGAEIWAALPWPAPLAALFVQQVREPATERACRSRISRLTAIDDAVSLLVQAQYEDNPYPRWMQAPPVTTATAAATAATPCSIDALLRRQFPLAPLQPLPTAGPLDVLVAGCGTGQHPIRVARQFPDARILAVDLSLSSLAYAQRRTDELGLADNIHYAQADILHLGSIDQRFDLIESAGVLHHLADPVAGWRVLVDLVRPGGLMFLGFYSALGRRDVVAARQRLAALGLPAALPDIRRQRQLLMADAQAPAFRQFLSSRDFYSASACRDLLFHVQEQRFSLLQLQEILTGLGLHFIGFELDTDVAAAYARQFPDDRAKTDLAQWHRFETGRPDTFSRMYQFWVQKPH